MERTEWIHSDMGQNRMNTQQYGTEQNGYTAIWDRTERAHGDMGQNRINTQRYGTEQNEYTAIRYRTEWINSDMGQNRINTQRYGTEQNGHMEVWDRYLVKHRPDILRRHMVMVRREKAIIDIVTPCKFFCPNP